MTLSIKPGVRIHGMRPEALIGLQVAAGVYEAHNKPCRVTSGTEGKHSRSSRHYSGLAFDLGTKNPQTHEQWPEAIIESMLSAMKKALGADFDVIYEGHHFHVEYDPKTGVNK